MNKRKQYVLTVIFAQTKTYRSLNIQNFIYFIDFNGKLNGSTINEKFHNKKLKRGEKPLLCCSKDLMITVGEKGYPKTS